jgi:hypothetical protein
LFLDYCGSDGVVDILFSTWGCDVYLREWKMKIGKKIEKQIVLRL